MPPREKAGFGGTRDIVSKRIIYEQLQSVAENIFTATDIECDQDNFNWMVVAQYRLPRNWSHIARTTPLLITFPMDYPTLPPIGFYMDVRIPQSPNGHLYSQAYHDAWQAPIAMGWKWYCAFLEPGDWRPAPINRTSDWKRGDNLFVYFALIAEALGSPD